MIINRTAGYKARFCVWCNYLINPTTVMCVTDQQRNKTTTTKNKLRATSRLVMSAYATTAARWFLRQNSIQRFPFKCHKQISYFSRFSVTTKSNIMTLWIFILQHCN